MPALLATVLFGCEGNAPSDGEVISRFHSQRGMFEALRTDLCAIAPQTIWIDSNNSRPRLAPERRAAFLKLMQSMKFDRIAAFRPQGGACSLEAAFWSTGMLDSGDDRQLVYAPVSEEDDLVVNDLSAVDVRATVHHFKPDTSHGHRRYLRRIEGDWWLVRNYWQ